MSLRFALLGLLSDQSMSGYDLTKRFEESLRYVWPARHSQIYPELNKLNEEGLIEIVDEGPRGRKEYRTTDIGKEAVRTWLLETEPDWTLRNEPALRSFFLWMLEPEQAQKHLREYRDWFQARLAAYQSIKEHWKPKSEGDRAAWIVLELGLLQAEAHVRWAKWALERYGDAGPAPTKAD
jgi:PadR family transcriptional regulator, regulatory protein AphA